MRIQEGVEPVGTNRLRVIILSTVTSKARSHWIRVAISYVDALVQRRFMLNPSLTRHLTRPNGSSKVGFE